MLTAKVEDTDKIKGLAIAREIVELHGGAITAGSQNEVIEFEVILPFS